MLTLGSVQLILCGDFFQLPPVRKSLDPLTVKFCFESPAWQDIIEQTIVLDRVYRQEQDSKFIDLLHRCRIGKLTTEDYALLNTRRTTDTLRNQTTGHHNGLRVEPTVLYATRQEVQEVNNAFLDAIPTEVTVGPYALFFLRHVD